MGASSAVAGMFALLLLFVAGPGMAWGQSGTGEVDASWSELAALAGSDASLTSSDGSKSDSGTSASASFPGVPNLDPYARTQTAFTALSESSGSPFVAGSQRFPLGSEGSPAAGSFQAAASALPPTGGGQPPPGLGGGFSASSIAGGIGGGGGLSVASSGRQSPPPGGASDGLWVSFGGKVQWMSRAEFGARKAAAARKASPQLPPSSGLPSFPPRSPPPPHTSANFPAAPTSPSFSLGSSLGGGLGSRGLDLSRGLSGQRFSSEAGRGLSGGPGGLFNGGGGGGGDSSRILASGFRKAGGDIDEAALRRALEGSPEFRQLQRKAAEQTAVLRRAQAEAEAKTRAILAQSQRQNAAVEQQRRQARELFARRGIDLDKALGSGSGGGGGGGGFLLGGRGGGSEGGGGRVTLPAAFQRPNSLGTFPTPPNPNQKLAEKIAALLSQDRSGSLGQSLLQKLLSLRQESSDGGGGGGGGHWFSEPNQGTFFVPKEKLLAPEEAFGGARPPPIAGLRNRPGFWVREGDMMAFYEIQGKADRESRLPPPPPPSDDPLRSLVIGGSGGGGGFGNILGEGGGALSTLAGSGILPPTLAQGRPPPPHGGIIPPLPRRGGREVFIPVKWLTAGSGEMGDEGSWYWASGDGRRGKGTWHRQGLVVRWLTEEGETPVLDLHSLTLSNPTIAAPPVSAGSWQITRGQGPQGSQNLWMSDGQRRIWLTKGPTGMQIFYWS